MANSGGRVKRTKERSSEGGELGSHKLLLDGDWSLLELSGFGKQYLQVYSLYHALEFGGEDDNGRIEHAFRAFPWAGGWSTVDFYDQLRFSTPPTRRPQIIEIEYASPGFIELWLAVKIGTGIATSVAAVAIGLERGNKLYRDVQKGFTDHKLNKLNLRAAKLKLTQEQIAFAEKYSPELAKEIAFKHLEELRAQTDNPVITLKVLASLYRRLKDLAKLQLGGQIRF